MIGLRWAIDRAMDSHRSAGGEKQRNREHITNHADHAFSPEVMVEKYVDMYRSLLPALSLQMASAHGDIPRGLVFT